MLNIAENPVDYARQRGLLDATEQPLVESLVGGVACTVLRLHASRGPVVIKQALEKFRVREEWIVDPRRNLLEAQFQKLARQALGAEHVPQVLDIDTANFAYTMTSAPLDAKNWKSMLLAGDVRPELGPQCRELLAKLHAMPVPDFLDDGELFRQQRIEPYFEFIRDRYPEVQPIIALLKNRHECVTHGDYTPKNFLIAGETLILLDYEVVHVGWPEFDVATIVNHLTLKFIRLANPGLLETARQFLGKHEVHLPLLGALMLARVDGKSPAEYLHEEHKSQIRVVAKQLLSGAFESFEQFIADALLGKRGARSVRL